MPLITVYIPTFNRIDMLRRAVDSVLNQSFQDFEIIVVDDCSSDSTVQYLIELSQNDKRVRFFQNIKNSGACVSRNKAITESKGKYITGLDDDDEFADGRLDFLINNFDPDFSFICTTALEIRGENSTKISNASNLIFNDYDLYFDNVAGNQFFTLTERLKKIGGFDALLTSSQDLDIFIRLCQSYGDGKRYGIANYILHTDHEALRISTSSRKVDGMRYFYKKHQHCMTFRQKIYHQNLISLWVKKPSFSFINFIILCLLNPKKVLRKAW